MSGPKVVRIVSQKERQLIKDKWVKRLEDRINSFEAYAEQHGLLNDDLKKDLQKRLHYYQNMSTDDFEKIEREIPRNLEFLSEEKKKLGQQINVKRRTIWDDLKHHRSTYHTVKAMLLEKGLPFTDFDLPKEITVDTLAEYAKKVESLHQTLSNSLSKTNAASDENQALQKRLSEGSQLLTVKEWKTMQPQEKDRLEKLEEALRELFLQTNATASIQGFLDRCTALDRTNTNYALQLDSLIIEVARFTKEQQQLEDLRGELDQALSDLKTLDISSALLNRWQQVRSSGSIDEIEEILQKANELYAQQAEDMVVAERRAAIKAALESTGYTVNNNMETAWVENGHLVVKKTKNDLYGMELKSPINLQRLQLRVVADENRKNERSPSLDKQEEERWCNTFEEFKALLEAHNLSVVVDKVRKPGEVPVKNVMLDQFTRQKASARSNKYHHKK